MAGEDRRPGDDVSGGHCIEHLAGIDQVRKFYIGTDQIVVDESDGFFEYSDGDCVD